MVPAYQRLRSHHHGLKLRVLVKAYITAGDASNSFERIINNFKAVGLFVLENGELECFVRTIGNHGPKWVNEVLSRDIASDPELENARQFIRQL